LKKEKIYAIIAIMKKQKGFIQIPLLIVIIISVIVATATTGVVLNKQGKLTSFIASISQILKRGEVEETQTTDIEAEIEKVKQESDGVKSEVEQIEAETDKLEVEAEGLEEQQTEVTEDEIEKDKLIVEPEPNLELEPEVYTKVKGIISSDTTWAIENSPYLVVGNILINEGTTLTIEAGVKIYFEESPIYRQHNLQVDGILVAKGNKNKKIVFTSKNAHLSNEESWIGWGSIRFSDKSIDWNEETKIGSIMEYCIIEYGGRDEGLISIVNSSPSIKNSVLRFSEGDALRVRGNPKIIDNQIQSGRIMVWEGTAYFSRNEVTGQGFYIVGGSPIITKNNIINNNGDTYGGGIRIDRGSPKITYNNIINNAHNGISILGGSPVVENNNIYNNKVFSILLTDTKNDFNFPNNWWGTTNSSVINSLIHDFDDDYTLGKVNYQPIVTSEISDAGIKK